MGFITWRCYEIDLTDMVFGNQYYCTPSGLFWLNFIAGKFCVLRRAGPPWQYFNYGRTADRFERGSIVLARQTTSLVLRNKSTLARQITGFLVVAAAAGGGIRAICYCIPEVSDGIPPRAVLIASTHAASGMPAQC